MVQHDNRVQMRGRQSAATGVSRRRQKNNAEIIFYQYGTGGEWYEEEEENAVGQGRNPYGEDCSVKSRRMSGRPDAGNGWGDEYERENSAKRNTRRKQVDIPVIANGAASVRPAAGGTRRAAEHGRPGSTSANRRTAYRQNASAVRSGSYGQSAPAVRSGSYGHAASAVRSGSYGQSASAVRRRSYGRNASCSRNASSGRSISYSCNAPSGRDVSRSAARARRRKRVLMQRMIVCLWAVCVFLAAAIFLLKNDKPTPAADGQYAKNPLGAQDSSGETKPKSSSALVQGLPAEEFAKHPEWEEKFLTLNEYSRPGDPLESVKNIFVHYTANPGTSAAQNRSYFEQQKDVHQASVSAHFIIGYEGEIIQCVPLDEVAYAVQTRNYDSVSIECCHLAKDGSFTQETYDSLISLLAWLTDVYDLDSEDILRHYDCGGKKCPLYYTENPDAWEQLKKDVDKL